LNETFLHERKSYETNLDEHMDKHNLNETCLQYFAWTKQIWAKPCVNTIWTKRACTKNKFRQNNFRRTNGRKQCGWNIFTRSKKGGTNGRWGNQCGYTPRALGKSMCKFGLKKNTGARGTNGYTPLALGEPMWKFGSKINTDAGGTNVATRRGRAAVNRPLTRPLGPLTGKPVWGIKLQWWRQQHNNTTQSKLSSTQIK